MISPLPATLVREGNNILDPEEKVLIHDIDLRSNIVYIQRADRSLEVRSLEDLAMKSDLVLSALKV